MKENAKGRKARRAAAAPKRKERGKQEPATETSELELELHVPLFDSVLGHEALYIYRLGLSDSVSTR
jgi:hypothetical protein